MQISDALLGALIAAIAAFLGVLAGGFLETWRENRKIDLEHRKDIRNRMVGANIQTSEVLEYINSMRNKHWPMFWKKSVEVDLGRSNLAGVDLRRQDLRKVKLFRVDFTDADLDYANFEGCDLGRAILVKAKLTHANLKNASLVEADLEEAYLQEANLEGANLENANLRKANLQ
jgi:uncharacterized protein YjbI with pentapeptide repeats